MSLDSRIACEKQRKSGNGPNPAADAIALAEFAAVSFEASNNQNPRECNRHFCIAPLRPSREFTGSIVWGMKQAEQAVIRRPVS
jgi:hypothetical protein